MDSVITQNIINERYQLLELLGSGSMGTVYRVHDLQNDQIKALKRVMPAPGSRLASLQNGVEGEREALKHEFAVLAMMDHPHIVRVFDCGFDRGGRPFYTMEYLHGQTITAFGQDRPQGVKLDLLAQLFAALAYLHARDVLQRDLKPSNILVVDGRLKLTDFGLAACEARYSHAVTTLQGTAAYMAPELLMGQPPTKAADLYAAGMIAYELLAGHHPYDLRNMNRLILSILHEAPDLEAVPEPAPLRELVGSLLAREPEQRPASAEAVVRMLADIKTGQQGTDQQ